MAAKKAPAKTVRKSRAKAVLDKVWVISERTKLFTWTPVFWSDDYEEAKTLRLALEAQSVYGGNGYKMTSVPKVKTVQL